jgi:acetolactate decarboxylase
MILLALTAILTSGFKVTGQHATGDVKIIGAMKDVMWKGRLKGIIDLDTLSNKQQLYGMGPLEYLKGELLVIDGRAYKSTVQSETEMKVEETFHSKAPFFGYSHIRRWSEQALPDSIRNIQKLESYLDEITRSLKRPFLFKLSGEIETATIHIVNLPAGTKVNSPEKAHQGKTSFTLKEEHVDILGFFSTEHKSVFTHHDTYLHMHLITGDRQKMGHLDKLILKKGTVKLYLPAE